MSLAMFSWAIAWTNAKIVGDYLSFYNLVFFRFLLGFLSLLPFIIVKNNPLPKIVDLKYVLIPSVLFFIYNIAFFKGTHYGLAGTGGVLVTTLNPLCTILIMSLIKKRIIKKEIIGMFLGVIGGIIIMNLHKEGIVYIFNSNNIYFIICAITWGVMTVSVNYAQERINPYMFICLCYLFTMIISIPFTNLRELNLSDLDFVFYFNFFLVSIGAMSFGTSIYIYSTPILGPSKVSVFIFSVPFIAMGTAYIVLNEPFTMNIVVGGLLSLLSIYIVNK